MERIKCRLCLKTFANGRALGGHMRSHMLNLSSKREEYHDVYEDDDDDEEEEEEEEERPSQLSEETESGSLLPSSSSSSDDDGDVRECYGSRENPKKKSIRVQADTDRDPEFGFAAVDHHRSVVVPQDGESDTESSRVNPTRRRSKRTRKLGGLDSHRRRELSNVKKLKPSQLGCKAESGTEPEPLSSVSDTTTEEDLAVCLMMLSRDKWEMKNKKRVLDEDDRDDDHGFEENDTDESKGYRSTKNKTRGKFKCETCHKVFKSYQALGGHRASHKKNRAYRTEQHQRRITEHENENGVAEKKIHECPICFRVFSSGQALGGHKRSHGVGGLPENHVLKIDKEEVSAKQRLIDLNLPAPTDDDETSQVEVSVVFDE